MKLEKRKAEDEKASKKRMVTVQRQQERGKENKMKKLTLKQSVRLTTATLKASRSGRRIKFRNLLE